MSIDIQSVKRDLYHTLIKVREGFHQGPIKDLVQAWGDLEKQLAFLKQSLQSPQEEAILIHLEFFIEWGDKLFKNLNRLKEPSGLGLSDALHQKKEEKVEEILKSHHLRGIILQVEHMAEKVQN